MMAIVIDISTSVKPPLARLACKSHEPKPRPLFFARESLGIRLFLKRLFTVELEVKSPPLGLMSFGKDQDQDS